MKIVVTGGAGFIASHIVDAYLTAGHRVVVIDDLSKGFRRNINKKAKFYKADITDLALMERIFAKERPEAVNHHAAIAEVTRSMRDPIPTLTTNVLGTANLLLAFGHHGRHPKGGGAPGKFIFSSTGGAMYGDPKHLPVSEGAPEDPLSPYGLSKKLAEETIKFYAKQFGFEYFIFRYANVFGPRQNPHGEAGIVAIFGELMYEGKRPTIFGDGTKARDYVYVGDVAAANLAALRRGKNATVNLGRGKIITDREMFEAIAEAMRFDGKPIHAPYRPGEIYRISLDAARARKVLGWKPKMEFRKGIREAVKGLTSPAPRRPSGSF
jgi:UDP-glucose 4-epimerase